MDATLIGLRTLSTFAKQSLLDAVVIYPNTESIIADIQRAETLGVLISYSNLETDIEKIATKITKEPRFNQLSSRDLNIEILRSMILKPDLNYNYVEYIYFQRIKTPTLCLKNTNAGTGVSIFIDLNDARIQMHRLAALPDRGSDFMKSLPIAFAIVIAGLLIAVYQNPKQR